MSRRRSMLGVTVFALPGGRRSLVPACAMLLLVLASADPGAAGARQACGALDGKYEIEAAGGGAWLDGVQAPGITILSASDEEVAFEVADGWTVLALCVKTGTELNNYLIDAPLPVHGPATVTVTRAGPGLGLGHISFDTEVTTAVCQEVRPPEVAFDEPLYIDRQRAGGEPVSVVAQDGSISVSAHAGTTHIYKDPNALPGARDFALGYWNQTLNWRSTDGGRTWEYIGLAGQREGPHSPTSTGFSDPDYAIDQAGNIYNVEIDLANISVFKSPDDGQSYPIANPMVSTGDRPWLTALEPNEVFLYVNSLPKALLRSTDGFLAVWERLPVPPNTGKLQPDPLNPDDGLIGSAGAGAIAISADDGRTWSQHPGTGIPPGEDIFPVLAVDRVGNVYRVSVDGYNGPADVTPDGFVKYNYFNRAAMAWGTPVDIPIPKGDALWPWIIAGEDGRVAITWYQTLAGDPDTFFIYVAYTANGHGTTVPCSDGSTKFVPPQFTVLNASGRPIHRGDICLGGTGCNLATNFSAGDRRLGDFFTINHDLKGNLFIASADTMLRNPLGGPKPVGNPIFIRQIGGDRILEEPIPARPSRCLFPIPSC